MVSSALSPEDAVKWAAILNGIVVVSRTGLKLAAVVTQQTGEAPPPVISQPVDTDIEAIVRDVTPQVIAALRAAPTSDQAVTELAADIAEIKHLVADIQGGAVSQTPAPAPSPSPDNGELAGATQGKVG